MRTKPPGITRQPSPIARQQQPQDERARHELAVLPDRRGRQRHRLLRDEVDAAAADRLDEACARAGIEILADHDLAIDVRRKVAGKRRRDHEIVEPLHDIVAHGGIAEPPGRDIRQRRVRGRARPAPAPAGSSAWRAPRPRRSRARWRSPRVPSRIACTRPGTPSRERALSSSGSAKSESRRRSSTSARFRPDTVRMNTPSSRTVRSSPSTSRKPR